MFGLLLSTVARGKRLGLFVAEAWVTGIPTKCLPKSGIGAAIRERMRLPGKNLLHSGLRFCEAGGCNVFRPVYLCENRRRGLPLQCDAKF